MLTRILCLPRIVCLLACVALGGCAGTATTKPVADDKNQETAKAYIDLGTAYLRQNRQRDALDNLQRALELDPTSPLAHNVIALLYQRQGKSDRARKHYLQAIASNPQQPGVRHNYATFLCDQNQFAEAEKQFLVAVRDPSNGAPESSYYNAGICAKRVPDLGKAEVYFRQALQANKGFFLALMQMAILMHNKQSYLPSRAYLQRYLEVAKHTPESLWLGIRNGGAQGEKKAVAGYKLQLLSTFPESQQARLLLEGEDK